MTDVMRPYQQSVIHQVTTLWERGVDRVIVCLPTGAGKTVVASELRRGFKNPVAVAHQRALTSQLERRLKIPVFTVQRMRRIQESGQGWPCGEPDLIIWDECFVRGTLVNGRPIDALRPGDDCGLGKVVRIGSRTAPDRLVTINGCTSTTEHPYLTPYGWKRAIDLCPGDLLCMRTTGAEISESQSLEEDLLCPVSLSSLIRDHGEHQSAARFCSHAEAQSDVGSEDTRAGKCCKEGSGAECRRRERPWAYVAGVPASECHWLDPRASDSDWIQSPMGQERDTADLCPGPCAFGDETGRGSGWVLSSVAVSESTGPEKGDRFGWARVDRIEVHQRCGIGRYGEVCPDGRVYNLETESGCYPVGPGIVVHNCHHADSTDWQQLFRLIPDNCKMLALTATPWRFSHGTQQKIARGEDIAIGGAKNSKFGKGLGDLFGAMIVGVTPRQLVKSGYLVPLRVMNVVEAQDAAARVLDKVGPSWDEKRGKYTGRLTAASDIRLDPVDAYLRHGEGRKAMYFGHLVPAAERACERFNALGIKANVVHGKLDPEVCEERLAAFARNEYQVMCNVMQLTEGYDCPDVGCIIIDRGANNLNTYLQICGRGARTAPGKTDCLILDLTGCSTEHGDPQKDQDYWVVTSEGRAVSDLQCEVCGTRLSPMFPQRCMKCDPFRPKLGDPKELLDTGMRVYAQLKDLRDASDWRQLTDDERDSRIIAELEPFHAETDAEAAVRDQERASAVKRIADRLEAAKAAERAAAALKARQELAEREREMAAKLAEERKERAAQYAAELEERQAKFREEQREFAKQAAERQRSKDDALRSEFTAEEFSYLTARLATALGRNIRAGWSLGTAIRDVRNGIERFKDFYSQSSFDVPPAMKPLLEHVQKTWQGGTSPAEYELRRMMQDARTSRYGESWCRKKVKELFGVDGKQQSMPTAAPESSVTPVNPSVKNVASW